MHLDEELLNEYLDNVLDAQQRQRAEAHLAGCPDCRARLDELQAVFLALEALPESPLAHDLSAGVLRALPRSMAVNPTATVNPTAAENTAGLPPTLKLLPVLQLLAAIALAAVAGPTAWLFASQSLSPWLDLPSVQFGDMLQQSWLQIVTQIAPQPLAWQIDWGSFQQSTSAALAEMLAGLGGMAGSVQMFWGQAASQLASLPLGTSFSLIEWTILLGVACLAWLAANRLLLWSHDGGQKARPVNPVLKTRNK